VVEIDSFHFFPRYKLKKLFASQPTLNYCLGGRKNIIEPASYKSGMHNIRPVGQMWPVEALYPACKAHDFAYLACLFPKNIL
jgi:hypothetical protein